MFDRRSLNPFEYNPVYKNAALEAETLRDLLTNFSDHSASGAVYQPNQENNDARHSVRKRNAGGDVEVQSRQLSYGTCLSKQRPTSILRSSDEAVPSYESTVPKDVLSDMASSDDKLEQAPQVGAVRVVQSRPKPQCWEHGCNGRQFSSFANLLCHQREKSGQAIKSICPHYGADFTTATARNGHKLHQKCPKIRTEPTAAEETRGQPGKSPGQIDNEHQSPQYRSSMPELPITPSFARTNPSTGNELSMGSGQGRGKSSHPQPDDATAKEVMPSSTSKAAAFPFSSPNLTYTATSSLSADIIMPGSVAVVPDDICDLVQEAMPEDISDISDGDSFETSSTSENLNSPASITESRRKILIDKTVSWIVMWIDSRLGVLVFQAHGTYEEGPWVSSWTQAETCESGNGPTGRKKKGYDKWGHTLDDEDSDGEDCVPPPFQGSGAGDDEETVEFACPFLKHNSRKYGQIRSCSASGWKAIFRLKLVSQSQGISLIIANASVREHLYRCHRLPSFQCIRCRMTFKSSEKLLEHSQADIACEVVRDNSDQEGISHEQLMKLKSRKRNREASSEHDKWIHMYKILFPGEYLVPSPYFQRGNSGKGQESLLTALREHVGRELPRLIRPRLEETIDATIREALGPDILEGLVRDIFTQVLSTFPQQSPHKSAAMSGEKYKKVTSPWVDTFPQLALTVSDGLAFYNVPTSGTEENTSAAWVLPHQAGIEQPESSQQASQRISNESLNRKMESRNPTEMGSGPSALLWEDDPSWFPSTSVNNTIEGPGLNDLFNIDDFHDEFAAWLGNSDEGTSHADSGYFSLESVESMDDVTGKGKGKEVLRE